MIDSRDTSRDQLDALRAFIKKAALLEQESFRKQFAAIEKSSFGEIADRYKNALRDYLLIERENEASSADASNQDACKTLYRKLVKLTHPDANTGDSPEIMGEEEKIFKDVAEAYERNDLDGLMLQLLLVTDNQTFTSETTSDSLEVVRQNLLAKAEQIFTQAAWITQMDSGEFYIYLEGCIDFMTKAIAKRKGASLFETRLPRLSNS
jgi:hypothetical protein